MPFVVLIDGHSMVVADDQIERIRAAAEEAVRSVAAFVDIRAVTGRVVSVLVTAATSMRIEELPLAEEREGSEVVDDLNVDLRFTDFDF